MPGKNPEPLSGMVVPRFGEVASFMRLPVARDPKKLDIALVGVPWDGGTTNRPGARHGPREIRNMSTLMRRVAHANLVSPYLPCPNRDCSGPPLYPTHLADPVKRVQELFRRPRAARAAPLSARGDHL